MLPCDSIRNCESRLVHIIYQDCTLLLNEYNDQTEALKHYYSQTPTEKHFVQHWVVRVCLFFNQLYNQFPVFTCRRKE